MNSQYEQYLNYWEPLLSLIRNAEAINNSYSSVVGSKKIEAFGDLTLLTFQEIENKELKFSNGVKARYVGAYQLDKKELVNWALNAGLQPFYKFNSRNQDLIAIYLIETNRQKAGYKWRNNEISNEEFAVSICSKWAGLPLLADKTVKYKGVEYLRKRGDSYYSGIGNNKANVSPESLETILNQIKGNDFTIISPPLEPGETISIPNIPSGNEDSPFVETEEGYIPFESTPLLEYDDGEGNHDEKDVEQDDSNAVISEGDSNYPLEDAIKQSKENKFIVPTKGRISSPYNTQRINPITGKSQIHQGIDIARFSRNDNSEYIIYAVGDGTVVRSEYSNSYGNIVIIKHSNILYTLYAHMKKINNGVSVGARVFTFNPIGIMGSTGNSTGIHLHFEIIETTETFGTKEFYNATTKDPAEYMNLKYLLNV